MFHKPPSDQFIIDEYFSLLEHKKNQAAWLYGMIATYGFAPSKLEGFTWNRNNSININNRKTPVKPLHPQWVLLFQLKEKQPSNIEDCWERMCLTFKTLVKTKAITNDVTDLLLSHKLRRSFYRMLIHKQPSFATLF
jgi:hypothetical protein